MAPTDQNRAGIADAVEQLSEQTRTLVRREVEAARSEMWEKARRASPAAALLGAAAVLGAFAAASGYRFGIRLLEKALSPTTASLVATFGFGAGAAAAAVAGRRLLTEAPAPFPTETAEATRQAVADSGGPMLER